MGVLTREALEQKATDIFERLTLVASKKPASQSTTIASLSPRVRQAYLLGFGVIDGKDKTSEDVSKIMHISRETVERYWRKAHIVINEPAANTVTLR